MSNPLNVKELRKKLFQFYNTGVSLTSGATIQVGNFIWGVYAFYDYDGEPMYVGQTYGSLRDRAGRHITGSRSDVVAKGILDPHEVHDMEVWPLPQFQYIDGSQVSKKQHADFKYAKGILDSLESIIFNTLALQSSTGNLLNEKPPPQQKHPVTIPQSYRQALISPQIMQVYGHPDIRIARRANAIARISQVIADRKVDKEIRESLAEHIRRLSNLVEKRL